MCTDLDHPADVILHGWGESWGAVLEQMVLGMAEFMVPNEGIEGDEEMVLTIEDAKDDRDMLFLVMDEYLYRFSTELFVAKTAEAVQVSGPQTTIRLKGFRFVRGVHKQGTEIKAVTFHNMRISRNPDGAKSNAFVTLDI